MALYANYVPNPSFELGVTRWDVFNSGTRARVGSNAAAGSYSMRVQYNGSRNAWGGVQSTVNITPGGGPYTLSLNLGGSTEEHGAANNLGTRVTVADLLPGESIGERVQLAQQTFSRTTSGRVAVRNLNPRATADRLVVIMETGSSYFKVEETTIQSSGLVWAKLNQTSQGYNALSPDGTQISAIQWNNYQNNGWTLNGLEEFVVRDFTDYTNWASKSGTWTKSVVTQPAVSGGLATVYVDAVKLEQGATETAYVDGTTPGYVWEGDPHNSATLNVIPLSASGSGTLTSPAMAELRPVAFLEASGSGGLTGTAEITAEGTIRASGSGELTGTADLWNYGPMSASGEGGSTGTAEIYAIVPIEAHGEGGPGTGEHTPRAELTIAMPMSASGSGSLTGTIELTFPQPISASGSGSLTGTAHLDIGLQLSASGNGSLTGTAALDDAIPKGAFSDFAIYGVATTDTDPLKIGLGGGNAGTSSGANGQPWNRVHAEFMAPADQPSSNGYAWRRAAYAALGFRFDDVPAGNHQRLACVQLEPSTADNSPGPREYGTARTIRPLVHADRVNYADPELWTFIGSTNIQVIENGTSPIPNDPRPVRELTIAEDPDGFFGGDMVTPPPGTQCVLSIYLKGSAEVSQAQVRVLGKDLAEVGSSGQVFLPANEWLRIAVPFVTTDHSHSMAIDLPEVTGYPAVIYAAGYQVERGTTPTDFMWFVAGSRDYYYRDNGADDTKGVFYYRDIDERIPLVTAAIEEHLPLSMRASEPEFGLVPHLD